MKKRGSLIEDVPVIWIVILLVAVVLIAGFFILRGKDIGIIKFIENLFRFGK